MLENMTDSNLVFLDVPLDSREAVIEKLCHAFAEQGIVTDEAAYRKAVWEREEIAETGFENGIAIPHGKSDAVVKPAFAVCRITDPIKNWPSLDKSNKVKLVFLLAAPADNSGEHLRLLSTLSTELMDATFVEKLMNAGDKDAFMAALAQGGKSKSKAAEEKQGDKTVLVLTSCSAGIAHTYMAAEAMEKAGQEAGVRVLTEKQGANGIEDRFTQADIDKACVVVFCTNLPPVGKERFNGMPYVDSNVDEPLKNASGLLKKALDHPDGVLHGVSSEGDNASNDSATEKSLGARLFQAVQTGISYMIPLIVAAGVMIGIGQLGASFFGLATDIGTVDYGTDPNLIIRLLHYCSQYGNMIMKFMYPVFAMFMAFSLADRPGLVPGFVGGLLAAGLHFTFWGEGSGIPSGFFGALVLGAFAGLLADWLNKHIKLHKNLQAMKPMLIVPGLSVLAILLLNLVVVDPVFGGLNAWLQSVIKANQGGSAMMLAAIIAALTAFDLGGPVNKAAGAVAIGLAADGVFPLTARVMSIVMPAIGLGLATLLDRVIVKREVFNERQRVVGKTSLVLGFIAIGEGAIPFLLENPIITVSINVIGSILGSWVGIALGAEQWLPLPAIWGWPLVTNLPAYLIGLAVGIGFIAVANVLVRYAVMVRKEKQGR